MSDDEERAFERDVRAVAGEFAESGPLAIVQAIGKMHPTKPLGIWRSLARAPTGKDMALGPR